MSFNFGSSGASAFGSTAPKPTGFATPFGVAQTTTTPSTGSFGFGQTQQQQQSAGQTTFGSTAAPPAFGSTTFGAGTGTTAPMFGGSTFGGPTASISTPAFGSTFGTTQAPTQGLFGQQQQQQNKPLFGAQAPAPTGSLFGAPVSSASVAPSLFGTAQVKPAQPSLFGSGTTPSLFGQQPATTTPSLFGSSFGQPAASAAPTLGGGLFGSAPQNTAPSLFGTSTTPSAGFGGFGTGTGGGGGFGTGTGGGGGFGTGTGGGGGFGTSTGGGGVFGGFGTSGGGLFGSGGTAAPAPAPPVTPQSQIQQVIASVYNISVFNDERDNILKKWNMLQACWGTGKGYYNSTQPPVEYTPLNPFYRFKAMGYNAIPEQENSDGIVKLVFNKKVADLKNQQEVLKTGLAGILGNRPTLTVDIVLIKSIAESQTEVKICVSEKGVTGASRKIPATELAAYLNQPTQKQQLTNVGVTTVTAYVTPTKAELEEYLKNPPLAMDRQMWLAAIQDNPNPKKYLPVAINGFAELRARMLNQEYQTGLHLAFLDKVKKEVDELYASHVGACAQIDSLKQKFLELQHRLLEVLVKQESTRKAGMTITPQEEFLKSRFEAILNQLNMPKQYKGQVNELLSDMELLDYSARHKSKYNMDGKAQEEIKQFLEMQHQGISLVVDTIHADQRAVELMANTWNDMDK